MMYKFQAQDIKPHWIEANNWTEAEREFLDNFVSKNV